MIGLSVLMYEIWSSNVKISQNTQLLTEHLTPAEILTLKADLDLYQSIVGLKDYVSLMEHQHSSDATQYLTHYYEKQKKSHHRILEAKNLLINMDEIKIVSRSQAYEKAFNQLKELGKKVISLTKEGRYLKANDLLVYKHNELFKKTIDIYERFNADIDAERKRIAEHTHVLEKDQKMLTIITYCIAMIIGVIFLVTVPKIITNNINQLIKCFDELGRSGGDLTFRLPVMSKSELGKLASSCNHFIQYLQTMLQKIANDTETINNDVRSVDTVMKETGNNNQEQTEQLNNFVGSISELNVAVSEVAQQAQASSDEAEQARDVVSQSSQEIDQTITSVQRLVSDMENTANAVSMLEERSKSIQSVLQVIGGIADQTNLLALNAAIEAARAGESGRGFAVVADEVRALAQKTQQSTQSIQETLTGLNEEVVNAVSLTSEAKEHASHTSGSAASVSESMSLMIARVNSIVDFSIRIAAATEQQSNVLAQINSGSESMKDISGVVSKDVHSTMESFNNISHTMSSLVSKVRQFKLL